jgi:tetratricopeptide (TPR) repeat protein
MTIMKNLLGTILILVLSVLVSVAQPATKPKQKPAATNTSQPDINKMMEEAMKGENMSPEEKEQMKKMMKDVLPDIIGQGKTVDYPNITDNKQFMPAKNAAAIAAIPKRKLTVADIRLYTSDLYSKLMSKVDAEEATIIKSIIAKTTKARDLNIAAVFCMLQGHAQSAMAISMKAVQADPSNIVLQNNMAAMLTQYGYPAQSIPVLKKIVAETPGNSTVLSNMAYAWLGLGEKDSAKYFAGLAIRSNPFNPNAKLCGGLMEELNGDPIKATEMYKEALEDGAIPFTEEMVRNSSRKNDPDEMDFEKIKRSITIHEYFRKDWMKTIPLLSRTVSGYADDYAIQTGYRNMRDSLREKLESIQQVLAAGLEHLADKGEEEFVKEMAKDIQKGLSMMSKPAVIVLRVLHQYETKWVLQFAEDVKKLVAKTDVYKSEFERVTRNLKPGECKKYDIAAENYMKTVNPMIRDFYLAKTEQFRQWTNAWITWNWNVAGNPKNSILLQDFGFVGQLAEMYLTAMSAQVIINSSCKPQREPDPRKISQPDIPNFNCPVAIKIPSGSEWMQLSASSKDFDMNSYVKKTVKPIPHSSISYTVADRIGQPGFDPSYMTAHGDMTATYVNPQQKKRADEIQHQANLDMIDATPDFNDVRHKNHLEMIRELPYWDDIIAVKALLNKILSAKCGDPSKKPRFIIGLGTLTFEGPNEVSRIERENGIEIEYEDGSGAFIFNDGSIMELEAPNTYTVVDDDNPRPVRQPGPPKQTPKLQEFKNYFDTNGLQPTVSNSLQEPGIFQAIKDLFK